MLPGLLSVVKKESEMDKEKIPVFPLHKRSHYLFFCCLMVVILFFSFILATTLGSVDLSEESVGKVIINQLAGKEIYEPIVK